MLKWLVKSEKGSANGASGLDRNNSSVTAFDALALLDKPSLAQARELAQSFNLSLSDAQLQSYIEYMDPGLEAYADVAQEPDFLPAVKYEREAGHQPQPSENPFNAWYIKTDIHGAATGKLRGRTLAVKDNIALAGVKMMNGASILKGYTPEIDATVVTRVLDEGAHIIGKAQCEYYCLSGGSHTSALGAVENPYKAGYAAGGSSSGNAALLAGGHVDFAIGGDQGGSARTPASWCGVVGLKPTWGLVPYTGAMPIELTIDHLGPMTRNVADNALLLEVLAGYDGLDPRQHPGIKAQRYTDALNKSAKGLKIGILAEGFGHEKSETDVDACVRQAAETFKQLGADVQEVSAPMHHLGKSIWFVIATEGATQQMMKDNGHGFNWKGLYLPSMVNAHAAWRQRANELPHTLKFSLIFGEHMIRSGNGAYYAKAQNLGHKLTAAYDALFNDFDILLMPTTPMKATKLPSANASSAEVCDRAWENMDNTFPFDVTGHPALQVPCGMSDGLPIGMMLVGRHFEETTLYQAAHAFEQDADWKGRKVQ